MASVIVLKSDYDFCREASLQKVLKWFIAGKIDIVEEDEEREIGSLTFRIKVPLIVRLVNFFGYKPKSEEVPFSSNAVYERDRNICQYWHHDEMGKRFKYRCTIEDRTIDHVIPTSRGGRNNFENTVCACRSCNELIKKNRTPEEAGMELIRQPFVPTKDRGVIVKISFPFNPKKRSHQLYLEKYLGGSIAY